MVHLKMITKYNTIKKFTTDRHNTVRRVLVIMMKHTQCHKHVDDYVCACVCVCIASFPALLRGGGKGLAWGLT